MRADFGVWKGIGGLEVGEALADKRGMGSWVDYVRALRDSSWLGEEWDKEEWSGRQWKKLVVRTVREVACQDSRGG